jgi:hypothetical protein
MCFSFCTAHLDSFRPCKERGKRQRSVEREKDTYQMHKTKRISAPCRHVPRLCELVAEHFAARHKSEDSPVQIDPTMEVVITCGQTEAMAAAILAGENPKAEDLEEEDRFHCSSRKEKKHKSKESVRLCHDTYRRLQRALSVLALG